MSYLFDPNDFNKEEKQPDFHFRLDQLIPFSESEIIQDKIALDEVMSVAKSYGFSSSKVKKLIKAKKYNKKYNPSCDVGWIRLTKVFDEK